MGTARTVAGLLARLAGTFLCAGAFAVAVARLRAAPGDEAYRLVLELCFTVGLIVFGGVFFVGVLRRLGQRPGA